MRVEYKPDKMSYRGEEYDCIYISFHDDHQGESYTTTESDSVWFNQVTNQYREKHGIPYRDEIIALREQYGLSATKMALILGFGTNQYRLYEEGEVPSESNGKMIRSAMNPRVFLELVKSSRHQLADKDYEKIVAKVEEVIDLYDNVGEDLWLASWIFRTERGLSNGYAPQSAIRLKNLLLYVLDKLGETFQTKMNKILFYIDFLSYRDRGIAISGLAYDAIEFGPVPQRWDRVYSAFEEVKQLPKMVQNQECLALKAEAKPDPGCFSAEELAIIDEVCLKMNGLSSRAVVSKSHEEPAWQNHHSQSSHIPFEEAFSLQLF